MKLIVVGLGQCGGRIADEFSKLNSRARLRRRTEITCGTFAVNTDIADLSSLTSIKSDFQHRILIGNRKTGGHGVGKINGNAAQIAVENGDKVIDALRSTGSLYEADAFLLIAGSAGGTGSGSISVISKIIKERFNDKQVYALIALPFDHEENTDARTVYNTATCLKAVSSVTDAVFLVDNQRFIEKDQSLINNVAAINRLIAEPFYELLCAGEEKKAKKIGARLLDAGDIMQTLGGWTVLGYGVSQLPVIRLPLWGGRNFRKKNNETRTGIQAMDQALSNLSLKCDPHDSVSALYLLSAPLKEMNMDMVKELSEYLSEVAPNAVIRYGDYPRGGNTLTVTVMISQLQAVDKVKKYYDMTPGIIHETARLKEEGIIKLKELVEVSTGVPSLM